MDVRCERCKTEYEFDDAPITETGVTVKCTTCGHVFKVKKKALVVTVPVKPGELDQAHAPLTQTSSSSSSSSGADRAADKSKEWKVRQANGNVFSFKELTTLQKWIVERKVAREDEISLTGESWKRLGNIAELASFFQVTEDAQKAAQLSALQSSGMLGAMAPLTTPSSGYPAPPGPPMRPITQPFVPVVSFQSAPPSPPAPQGAGELPAAGQPPASLTGTLPFGASPIAIPVTAPPQAAAPAQPAPVSQPQPAPVPPPAPAPAPLAAAPSAPSNPRAQALPIAGSKVKQGGGVPGWLVALLLVVLAGGGFAGYQFWWLPQEQLKAEQIAAARADGERSAREKAAADAKAAEAAKAAEQAKATGAKTDDAADDDETTVANAPHSVDAGTNSEETAEVAAAPAVDAGAVVAAGPAEGATEAAAVVPAKAKKEPVHDFNWYMGQGDRLRDRDKAEAALDAYGRAADLEPDRPEPIAGRGLALLDMGSKLQAEAAFQQALKANPKYVVAIMGLAETYKAQGKKDEAIKYYQRYLEVAPQGPEAGIAKLSIERLSE